MADQSHSSRGLKTLLQVFTIFLVLTSLATNVPAQDSAGASFSDSKGKPWFDARLRAFFVAKESQARQLVEHSGSGVAPEVWPYFQAGTNGGWQQMTNLFQAMRARTVNHSSKPDTRLNAVWPVIAETYMAWWQFANWREKYVLMFGNDIMKSIPPGSIYFGGTDPGRSVMTAMSGSHADGKPFFTLTQNQLVDSGYAAYLRQIYGEALHVPSTSDMQDAFQQYMEDFQRRYRTGQLKSGELATNTPDGRVSISGVGAVMSINGLLVKNIFDHNPDREFYIEVSYPIEWMYPHLSPNGLILKINRHPLPSLPEEMLQQDHEFWWRYLQPKIGDWLTSSATMDDIIAFAEKAYLRHDLSGFTGDRQFIDDLEARRGFSKLRISISDVYDWRRTNAPSKKESERMATEAEFAARQAWVICPNNPDALEGITELLVSLNRQEEARRLAELSLKLGTADREEDPDNKKIKSIVTKLATDRGK